MRMEKLMKLETYLKRGPKAVILFHAFSSGPIDVNSLGRALAREDYTVLMPTLEGHGTGKPAPVLDYTIEDWKKDGEAAYEKLVADGYTDISVFGLSLGGIIATHVMLNYDVRSYGIFSSPIMTTKDSNVPESFMNWYRMVQKQEGIPAAEAKEEAAVAEEKLRKLLTGISEYTKQMQDCCYKEIDVPVFIGQGAADELIAPTQAGAFRDELRNAPEVDFNCYDEGPHVITTGRHGKELQKDLLRFLEKNA